MTNTDATRGDIYQRVTDQIVAMIEAGAGKYEMPWHRAAGVPINASSRKPYRGVNTVMLWAAAQAAGYPFDIWATFKQWKEMGANVRKGERVTSIVFWKISDPKDKEEGDADDAAGQEQRRSRALARGYAVFNAAQVDATPRLSSPCCRLPSAWTMQRRSLRGWVPTFAMAAPLPATFLAATKSGCRRSRFSAAGLRIMAPLPMRRRTGPGTGRGAPATFATASGTKLMQRRSWWPRLAPRSWPRTWTWHPSRARITRATSQAG